ncbi:VWA domain-containing protein [Shewanella maritima]|uniref:VWA domain-containing protein n=1 Tax=Shewanella maritima TaxID=2520507 RepID=UPI003735FD19
MIHFIRPEWLLGLIPAIFIFIFMVRRKQQSSAWQQYIAPHLSQALITSETETQSKPKWLLLCCWVIAIVALSGPAVSKQHLPVYAKENGRIIVLDMSLSMYATDLTPNRLSHLRFRATDLVDSLTDGETGLIAYAGDAFTISPLTRDKGTLLNLLPTLSPDIMPVRGSNAASALTLAQELLVQGGHQSGDVILVTDGMSPAQFDHAYGSLDPNFRLGILAIGTQQGSPIKLPDGQFLRDHRNEVVVARTNMNLLSKLAKHHNGQLFPLQTDGSDISALTHWLSTDGDTSETELSGEDWHDLGPYLALLLLLPVLLSFRHGIASGVLAPTFIISLTSASLLMPNTAQAFGWNDFWSTKNQQGDKAYQRGEYQQAANTFEDAQWQASAQYKAGDYEQALNLFEQDSSANGFFNQGNSLMQLHQFEKAIDKYQQALSLQADFPQAAENLELAKQLLQQSQQQEQEQNQQQDQNQQQEQEQQPQDQSEQDKQQSQSEEQSQSQPNEDQSNEDQSSQSQPDDGQQSGQSGDEQSSEQQSDSEQQTQGLQQEQQGQGQSQDQQSQQQSDDAGSNAGNNSQSDPTNEAQMQADAQSAAEAQANQQPNEQSEQHEATSLSQSEARKAEAQTDEEPDNTQAVQVSPTSMEQQPLPADMERALRAVSEDPQVLIRNKMQLEYQKRRQNGLLPKDQQQW